MTKPHNRPSEFRNLFSLQVKSSLSEGAQRSLTNLREGHLVILLVLLTSCSCISLCPTRVCVKIRNPRAIKTVVQNGIYNTFMSAATVWILFYSAVCPLNEARFHPTLLCLVLAVQRDGRGGLHRGEDGRGRVLLLRRAAGAGPRPLLLLQEGVGKS